MNILFGFSNWHEWNDKVKQLPYKVYIEEFTTIDHIMGIIKTKGVNVVIPVTYLQMFFVIDHMEQMQQTGAKLLCCTNKETITAFDNKCEFVKLMQDIGCGDCVPKVYMAKSKGIEHDNGVKFPCIFKLGVTCAGNGSMVCADNNTLNIRKKFYRERDYLVQEFISGPNEYSGHFCVVDGVVKWNTVYKSTNNNPFYVSRGKMEIYEKEPGMKFEVFDQIFKQTNYNGFACIDFKIVNNRVKIFEINPRLGGTIVCDSVDFAKIIMAAVSI